MAANAPPPGSLRLTGGSLRGRRLAVPPGQGVRPTSDRARETLFNVLTNRFKRPGGQSVLSEARVLDAFAGTGALGLEALSRGAAFAAFAENSRAHAAVLQANIDALGLADGLTSVRTTASAFSAEGGFGVILADPPYAKDRRRWRPCSPTAGCGTGKPCWSGKATAKPIAVCRAGRCCT